MHKGRETYRQQAVNQEAKLSLCTSITFFFFVLLSCLNTKTYLNAERGLQLFNFTVFVCTFLKPLSLLVVVPSLWIASCVSWFFLWLKERCWTLNRLISNYSDSSEKEKIRLKYHDQRMKQEKITGRLRWFDFIPESLLRFLPMKVQ